MSANMIYNHIIISTGILPTKQYVKIDFLHSRVSPQDCCASTCLSAERLHPLFHPRPLFDDPWSGLSLILLLFLCILPSLCLPFFIKLNPCGQITSCTGVAKRKNYLIAKHNKTYFKRSYYEF